MKKVILKIEGMSCSGCAAGLEKYLNKQKEIARASVNLVLAQAQIEYDEKISIEQLEQYVEEAGFHSAGIYQPQMEEKKSHEKRNLIFFGVYAFLILYISMAPMLSLPQIFFLKQERYYAIALFLLTIFFLFYGKDIFQSGIKNLVHKTPNMDTLVSLGVGASFFYSVVEMILFFNDPTRKEVHFYFESCAIIIFFLKLGRFIEQKNKAKTKEAIQELVQITPIHALLKEKNGEKQITIDEVKQGDILLCKPGMKIAVDGEITVGEAYLEEAFITGEALPVKKTKKDKVIAGSTNLDGYIEYKAEKIGKNSTISEIVRLVIEAVNTKAPIQRLADRVCLYFVPTMIGIAICSFLGYLFLGKPIYEAISAFVSVLVVACPCALGLATPLAIVISEGKCAQEGILVKTSKTLEEANNVDIIVFDKTGTLTYGNLKIASIHPMKGYTEKKMMELAVGLERNSTHPIASAFMDYEKNHTLSRKEVKNFKNLAGLGITATINHETFYMGSSKLLKKLKIKNTYEEEEAHLLKEQSNIVYLVKEDQLLGMIEIKDILRENAQETITQLKKLGKEVIMLTGDNEIIATEIAHQLGIQQVYASLLPKEKTKIIKQFINDGKYVMMVGDGINDAPSLAAATIGVSVHSGTDIAADSSDVILLHDNLEKIPTLISISKKTLANIKQNLFWAFFYNMCMIPIAIGFFQPFGLTMNPMFAGIAMTMSSLTVMLNALRLKK